MGRGCETALHIVARDLSPQRGSLGFLFFFLLTLNFWPCLKAFWGLFCIFPRKANPRFLKGFGPSGGRLWPLERVEGVIYWFLGFNSECFVLVEFLFFFLFHAFWGLGEVVEFQTDRQTLEWRTVNLSTNGTVLES